MIFRARPVGDDWGEIRAELERAFDVAKTAAMGDDSMVFVVRTDDLLGRGGAGDAMVATGLLSAARTAALEGAKKGCTVNVVAHDNEVTDDEVNRWARFLLDSYGVTGELVRIGTGHIGKALP